MNKSGILPVEFNVLVQPDPVKEKTAGGLLLPETTIERDEFGRTEGVMVAASPLAFTYAEWPDDAMKPKVGDRVVFPRYQAVTMKGRDGVDYWMMKDKAICGVMSDG